MDRPPLVLVPHTHWDREWYLPFEAFRERLVAMMDGLIDLLDRDPRFAHFHLDGQTATIDDYLAVRPEREADVRRLARDGRISVGPWFTQMDEFLVSGESLIRNLEWGLARARDLAGTEPAGAIGYLPDQFGHVGQMPQILSTAGVRRAVVWRGVPSAIDRTTFRWESPDGSWVIAEYLAFGYSLGAHIGRCATAEELRDALEQARSTLAPYALRERLLVTVGTDHESPPTQLPSLLEEVHSQNESQIVSGATDEAPAAMGSLAGYLAGPGPEQLPTWRGELRSAARAHLLPNVYSNRAHQKRQRARVETLIERAAEPLAALVPGFEWPEEEFREAWRLLLWNGAHDSVCGCSVDEVARAVDERYERAASSALDIVTRAMSALADRMASRGWVYFNPSLVERDGIPALGWRVFREYPGPEHEHVDFAAQDGHVLCGGFRFRLVDEGDVGDLYTFCPTPDAPPEETRSYEHQGIDLAARFRLMTVRMTPERFRGDGLYLSGTVMNGRPDHRVRLHVALDEPAKGSTALSPFEVVTRPRESEGGTETPSPTWPARGAVLAGGIAVIQQGVFEYEVIPDPPELAITLLRSVGTISRPQIATRGWAAGPDIATPKGQMISDSNLFWIGLRRGLGPEDLNRAWEDGALPVHTAEARGGGYLPDSGSLLDIEGAELSSVRKVDGVVEVRVWNPSNKPREARVAGTVVRLGPARIETVRLPRDSLHFQ